MRERTHWNSSNIRPRDPVLLGLCNQADLHQMVEKARRAAERACITLPKPPEIEAGTDPETTYNPYVLPD